ncbi:MAG: patatin family protein [Candidatus Pelagibacterales bacterium]|jgi:predicted patatin/cPLA2 family phospholipase|tara:strand:+ start:966 stop:1811 length:846 start_codon:yes stop_codon:yes gene_type:complete
MENKKTALIVEGGGQRGVFSFGITDTFINRNYDPFDIYMGVSNGVAVLCWYLIRETDNNLEKMLYAAKGDYLSYKNIFIGKDIIKFHQMYEDGEKMFKPNMEKIKNNLKGKDYIAVVTDAIEANAEYYSFGDGEWMPKMIASGTLPILVRTPSLIDGRRKFDGGVADPLPVEKAYEMGAKKIIVIRTYEKKFRRKLKIENYIGALLSREYPKLRKALLVHDKTYNRALDFINNPPSDCEIVQLCPPEKLKSKRDSKNIEVLKADYKLGKKVAKVYLDGLEN